MGRSTISWCTAARSLWAVSVVSCRYYIVWSECSVLTLKQRSVQLYIQGCQVSPEVWSGTSGEDAFNRWWNNCMPATLPALSAPSCSLPLCLYSEYTREHGGILSANEWLDKNVHTRSLRLDCSDVIIQAAPIPRPLFLHLKNQFPAVWLIVHNGPASVEMKIIV